MHHHPVSYCVIGDKGMKSGNNFGSRCSQSDTEIDAQKKQQRAVKSLLAVPSSWNKLNIAIFIAYSLSVASVSVPVTLAPIIATDITSLSKSGESEASFASKITSSAVLGTSLGKFLNGGLGDVFGARRILVIYAILGGLSLLLLSISHRPRNVLMAGALVEFFQAVQWPCLINMLTSHYGALGNNNTATTTTKVNKEDNDILLDSNARTRYETAINIVALASRFGAIMTIPFCSFLLRNTSCSWRRMCQGGAGASLVSTFVYTTWTRDSPTKLHDPINPPPSSINTTRFRKTKTSSAATMFASALHVLQSTIFPSLRSILGSGTFWTVSLAHTGGSIVRSSERLLGTYFENTSDGTISKLESGGYSVVMALGLVTGLMIWGSQFSNLADSSPQRGNAQVAMIQRLYALAVGMCMLLCLFAMPPVRDRLNPTLAWGGKLLSCFILAASLAVQYYHIPAMVASIFYSNRNHRGAVGLYVSYTDGVACAISSFLIRTLGRIVQHGNPKSYGWAFCWGDIAIVIAATGGMMVHFLRNFVASNTKTRDMGSIKIDPRMLQHPYFAGPAAAARAKLAQLNTALKSSTSPSPRDRPTVVMSTHDLMLFDTDSSDEDDNILNPLDEASNIGTQANNTSFVEMIPIGVAQQDAQLKLRLLQLLELDQNTKCVDCDNLLPRWASIIVPINPSHQHIMGCFCCQDCASIHRRLGVHILFVRSVDHDTWKEKEVDAVEFGGNAKVNLIYEARLDLDSPSKKGEIRANSKLREQFIFDKYQRRLWMSDLEESSCILLDFTSYSAPNGSQSQCDIDDDKERSAWYSDVDFNSSLFANTEEGYSETQETV